MVDFQYANMFPLGEDTTDYRFLTGDHIESVLINGQSILKIAPEGLTLVAEQAYTDVSHLLRRSHLKLLARILDDPEASDNDRYVALEIIKNYEGLISLLVTDVVMPKMNGREVARQAQALLPDLKVLYMSGYTDDAIAQHGVLESGVHFIEKPFTSRSIAEQIRKILDSR